MIWVIIACTLLIIVCLGGGKRLGQIILGAIGIIGLAVLLGNSPPDQGPHSPISILAVVGSLAAFFLLMAFSMRRRSNGSEPRKDA